MEDQWTNTSTVGSTIDLAELTAIAKKLKTSTQQCTLILMLRSDWKLLEPHIPVGPRDSRFCGIPIRFASSKGELMAMAEQAKRAGNRVMVVTDEGKDGG